MRLSEHLQPDESICIICEGEKTEPYFFEELIAWMEREQLYRNYQYQIYPIPVRHDDSDNVPPAWRRRGHLRQGCDPRQGQGRRARNP